MKVRTRELLMVAWTTGVVVVLALNVIWPLPGQELSWPWATGLMAFPVAGGLLLARRPGNAIGRILALVGVAAAVIFTATWYALTRPDAPLSRHVEALSTVMAVAQFAGVIALLHLFPTGRPHSRWHARLFGVFVWWMAVMALMALVDPGPLDVTGRPNPFGVGPAWLVPAFQAGAVALPVFTVAGIWVLLARRRRAGPVERAQLRWFFSGAAWVLAMVLVVVLFPQRLSPALENLVGVGIVVAFWSLPAATVVAVTRYRLYEIDRVISRTATYSVVAAVLAVVYASTVVGLQAILPVGGSDLAVAGSTLAAAVLFNPVRRGVQRGLDRRFNRARYEADLVTAQFAARLRRELDLDAIGADLARAVTRTIQPASVRLWMRDR